MTIDEIKRSTDIKEVFRRYGVQTNNRGFARCPFHSGDREPSLKVYKDSFFCFGCNESGDVFDFVQKMENCSFAEAFKILGGNYEKPTAREIFSVYHRKNDVIRKQKRKQRLHDEWLKDIERLKAELAELETKIEMLTPLTDKWCDFMSRKITVSGQLDQLCGIDGKFWQEWAMGGEFDG